MGATVVQLDNLIRPFNSFFFSIIDDGNYLFSTNALSANPSDSLMTFLIRINKQSNQHCNYRLKYSSVTGVRVPLEASRLPLHTDTVLESHTGPPHTRSPLWPRGPCSWAVQGCKVQTSPLTHSPRSGLTPEPHSVQTLIHDQWTLGYGRCHI